MVGKVERFAEAPPDRACVWKADRGGGLAGEAAATVPGRTRAVDVRSRTCDRTDEGKSTASRTDLLDVRMAGRAVALPAATWTWNGQF